MNTDTPPTIEPVTDDDVMVAVNLPARALEPHTRRILEQDRRRVAERQANHGTTHAEGCVSWGRGHYECAMVEIERLRAEVAMLRAACAAKDAALKAAVTLVRDRVPSGPDLHNACAALEAALSTDAGKCWIDASGAVWAIAVGAADGSCTVATRGVPDDWAGSPVVIVRVAK